MKIRESLRQEPIIFLSTKMWKFAKGHRPAVIFYLVLSAFASLLYIIPPIFFGKILNEIQTNGVIESNLYYLGFLISMLFFLELGSWLLHGPSRVIENTTAFRIDRAYKKYLYNAVLSLPLKWHSDHDSGNTIDKINKSTDALFNFGRNTFNILRVIVRLVSTTIVLWYFNPYLAIGADFLLLLAFIGIFRFDLKLVSQYKELSIFDNKSSAKVYDSISNVTTIKVLAIENPILTSISKSWNSSYNLYKKNKIQVELKWFTGTMFFTLVIVLPLAYYIFHSYSVGQVILVGSVSTIYMFLNNLNDVYYTFAGMYEDMMVNKARVQNVEDIEKEYENLSATNRKVVNSWKTLLIKKLNFSYDENGQKVLNDFAFQLKQGERVAIIGESGSGKSTILKIIHGMYEDVLSDIIITTEKNIKEYENISFAKFDFKSTLVPQEPEVFSASIKENLTLLTEFTDEEIKHATDMAVFSDVIGNLPNGIDSVVNEKGVNLSGGQKQRLALSRALLFSKEKNLILLDESTSSVDPLNEVKIYQNIFENFKEATILASIHKMNLLKYFDRIVMMEKGKIVGDGSFENLLATNVEFKNSWDEYIKNNSDY